MSSVSNVVALSTNSTALAGRKASAIDKLKQLYNSQGVWENVTVDVRFDRPYVQTGTSRSLMYTAISISRPGTSAAQMGMYAITIAAKVAATAIYSCWDAYESWIYDGVTYEWDADFVSYSTEQYNRTGDNAADCNAIADALVSAHNVSRASIKACALQAPSCSRRTRRSGTDTAVIGTVSGVDDSCVATSAFDSPGNNGTECFAVFSPPSPSPVAPPPPPPPVPDGSPDDPPGVPQPAPPPPAEELPNTTTTTTTLAPPPGPPPLTDACLKADSPDWCACKLHPGSTANTASNVAQSRVPVAFSAPETGMSLPGSLQLRWQFTSVNPPWLNYSGTWASARVAIPENTENDTVYQDSAREDCLAMASLYTETDSGFMLVKTLKSPEEPPKPKVLCLHGGGSTLVSDAGMLALINAFPHVDFVLAEAPSKNLLWIDDPPGGKSEPTTDPDWDALSRATLDAIVATQGPFAGILGFSQGAAYAVSYVAYAPKGTFQFAMLFAGYLPETHTGLMNRITAASPFGNLPAMVWAGKQDFAFRPLADELKNAFYEPTFIVSDTGTHNIPTTDDQTLPNVQTFLQDHLAAVVLHCFPIISDCNQRTLVPFDVREFFGNADTYIESVTTGYTKLPSRARRDITVCKVTEFTTQTNDVPLGILKETDTVTNCFAASNNGSCPAATLPVCDDAALCVHDLEASKSLTQCGGQVCCKAMIASCMACDRGVSIAELCTSDPTIVGCNATSNASGAELGSASGSGLEFDSRVNSTTTTTSVESSSSTSTSTSGSSSSLSLAISSSSSSSSSTTTSTYYFFTSTVTSTSPTAGESPESSAWKVEITVVLAVAGTLVFIIAVFVIVRSNRKYTNYSVLM